jgi:HEAT repeat protein
MASLSIVQCIRQLSEGSYTEQCKAEETLKTFGQEAVEPLIAVVEKKRLVVAFRAARVLHHLGAVQAVLPIARLILQKTQTQEVLLLLTAWTGPIQVNSFEARLLREAYHALRDGNALESAFFTLVKISSPDWVPPSELVLTELNVTIKELPGLIQSLRSIHHYRREAATTRLIALGPAAVPALIEAMETGSPLVCYRATEALGQIGDVRALWPLLAQRKSLERDMQETNNAALLKLAAPLAETATSADIPLLIALVQHLRYDTQAQTAAISAAEALERLAHTEPSVSLRGALKWLKPLLKPLPPSFKTAYLAIEAATAQGKDLPLLPNSPPAAAMSLPLPADASKCLKEDQ